jgi:hypothetical protein
VISGVRKVLNVPLARPPGRQGFMTRWQAECCAGLVYLVWAVGSLWMTYEGERGAVYIGAMFAYAAAGLIMFVLAATSSASILAAERDRRTMETMVITPGRHEKLALGRFWCVALPWLRFVLWMLPLYIVQAIAAGGSVRTTDAEEFFGLSTIYVFAPKVAMLPLMGEGMRRVVELPCWAFLLMIGRVLADSLDVVTAVAIAFYASARFWRASHAMLVAGLIVPASMLTVFCAPEWVSIGLVVLWEVTGAMGPSSPTPVFIGYLLGSLAVAAVQIALVRWLVLRVARRFDSYALGAVRGI